MRLPLIACALILLGPGREGVGAQEPLSQTGVIQVQGADLPYVIEGKGRPCLVYGSQLYYPRVFSSRFKAALRCAHVPERGFVAGASRMGDAPFGIMEAVKDIEAARVALAMDEFVLVGHSIHGLVALAYAALYPQHVSHVIAIGGVPSVPIPRDSVLAYRARTFEAERRTQHELNRRARDSLLAAHPGRADVANYIANGALYWADPRFDSTPLWEDIEINAQLASDLQSTPFSWEGFTESVSVPAFVGLGRHDYVATPNIWSGAHTPFANLTIRLFENAGHTPQLEDPEAFDSELFAWLDAHR